MLVEVRCTVQITVCDVESRTQEDRAQHSERVGRKSIEEGAREIVVADGLGDEGRVCVEDALALGVDLSGDKEHGHDMVWCQ